MLADLLAALDGCRAAGADEIVVCDAHNDGGNLDPDAMPAGVTLMSGSPTPGSMMEGIGPGFDAALFVGYHARAGTPGAVLEHTWTYRVFGVSVGGVELGEFGLGAMLAGHFGVPAVYVSGDDKVAAEARALVPGVTRDGREARGHAYQRRARAAGRGPRPHPRRRRGGARGRAPGSRRSSGRATRSC